MGFLDKVKELFTEEIEVEETPIKKEVMKVEIPAPTVIEPEPRVVPIREVERVEEELSRREEKVRTPVFFDDKDFINLEQPKPVMERSKPKPKVVEAPLKEAYGVKKEEPKKKFAPSPIISPVYGVLDKNYHKEDIATRSEMRVKKYPNRITSSRALNIDDVMKKAYGTLEDELETSMYQSNSIPFKEEPKEEVKQKDIFDEFNLLDRKPIHTEEELPSIQRKINIDPLSGLEMDMKEDDLLNDNFGDELNKEDSSGNMIEEAMDKIAEDEHTKEEDLDLKESDLFNLIDSMYEKRDEE